MECFAALGLTDTASLEEVCLAYKTKARLLHPDLGGDPAGFYQLNAAYETAKQEVAARKCSTCGGSGKVTHTHGFSSASLPCPTCK